MAIIKELLNTVPVNILIDQNIVLHWHCCKSHNLSTIAITCTDFSQSIHGPCTICDQNSQHGKDRNWFAWQCWYFSGLGTEEIRLTKLFQCTCHQLLYHNWPYILSPFFYPMWVQPWVKHIKNLMWYILTVFEMDTFRRHLQVANLKSVLPQKVD